MSWLTREMMGRGLCDGLWFPLIVDVTILLSAMDVSGPTTMKDAARCDK